MSRSWIFFVELFMKQFFNDLNSFSFWICKLISALKPMIFNVSKIKKILRQNTHRYFVFNFYSNYL